MTNIRTILDLLKEEKYAYIIGLDSKQSDKYGKIPDDILATCHYLIDKKINKNKTEKFLDVVMNVSNKENQCFLFTLAIKDLGSRIANRNVAECIDVINAISTILSRYIELIVNNDFMKSNSEIFSILKENSCSFVKLLESGFTINKEMNTIDGAKQLANTCELATALSLIIFGQNNQKKLLKMLDSKYTIIDNDKVKEMTLKEFLNKEASKLTIKFYFNDAIKEINEYLGIANDYEMILLSHTSFNKKVTSLAQEYTRYHVEMRDFPEDLKKMKNMDSDAPFEKYNVASLKEFVDFAKEIQKMSKKKINKNDYDEETYKSLIAKKESILDDFEEKRKHFNKIIKMIEDQADKSFPEYKKKQKDILVKIDSLI